MKGKNYFSWEQAVAKENIQPHTKLVLYIILNYNTVSGGLVLPPFDTLVAATGLTREVFIKHLKAAHKHGFSEITTPVLEIANV